MARNPNVLAGRAIASVMVQRYTFYPLITLALLFSVATVCSAALTAVHSPWWLLLALPLALWFVVVYFFLFLSFLAYTKLRPRALKASERKQIISFVRDFGIRYAAMKGAKKNPTTLAGIIVWKFWRSRGKTTAAQIITEPITEMKDLKYRFSEIAKLFT